MKNQSKKVVLAAIVTAMMSACDPTVSTADTPAKFSVASMTVVRAKPVLVTAAAVVANPFDKANLQTSTSSTLAEVLAAMKPKAGVEAEDVSGQFDQIALVVTPATELSFKDMTALPDFKKSAVVLNKSKMIKTGTLTVDATYSDLMSIDHTVDGQKEAFTPRVLVFSGANKLTIKGAPTTGIDSIGTLLTSGFGNEVALTDGAKVQLDSGRLVGTKIVAEVGAGISFREFVDAAILGGTKLQKRHFFVGDKSSIESVDALEISEGQTVTLDDKDDKGVAVSGSTGGLIKAPLTVDGKLVITKGQTEGVLTIGKNATTAGEVQLVSGTITGTVLINAKGVFTMSDSAGDAVKIALAAKTVADEVKDEANKFAKTSEVTGDITNTAGTATFSGGTVHKIINTGKFTMSDSVYAAAVARISDADVTNSVADKTAAIGLLAWTANAGDVDNQAGGEFTLSGGNVGVVTNAGKFTMSGGNAGAVTNNEGGEFTLSGGKVASFTNAKGTFTFDGAKDAEITGVFANTGEADKPATINLATGKTLKATGGLTVDANTVINLVLRNTGAGKAAGAGGTPAAVVAVPVLDTVGNALDLNAAKEFNLLAGYSANLVKDTTYLISTGTVAPSLIDAAKIKLHASVKKADGSAAVLGTDITVAVNANTLLLTVVNDLQGQKTAPTTWATLGKMVKNYGSRLSNSARSMMNTHFSSDMNAVASDVNGLSITTSADQSNNSNFVGMSFSATSDAKFGAYVGYTSVAGLSDAKVSEFGMFSSTKFAGLNVVNSVAYGSNENQMIEGGMNFNVDSKSLVAQSKTSYAFDVNGVTFAPNFVLGMGQLMSQNNSFKSNIETLNLSADATAAFGGFGLDMVSNFKVSTMNVQAFASLNVSSEFGSRQMSLSSGETASINGKEASFIMGGKVSVDGNSSFYATTEVSKTGDAEINSKVVAGLNFKI